jgi:hypothetical protein
MKQDVDCFHLSKLSVLHPKYLMESAHPPKKDLEATRLCKYHCDTNAVEIVWIIVKTTVVH